VCSEIDNSTIMIIKHGLSYLSTFKEGNERSYFHNACSIIIIVLLIVSIMLSGIPYGSSFSSQTNSSPCRCAVFRFDSIQDYWLQSAQLAVMDLFLSKNMSLSPGLIMNALGNDPKVIEKVSQGANKGLFELALNGWNYTDYTKLSEQQQKDSLSKANEKVHKLFGKQVSDIFIPPYGLFNNATLNAMVDSGIRILSSSSYLDSEPLQSGTSNTSNRTQGKIYHLPATIAFKKYEGGKPVKNSVESIVGNATKNISTNGYAIIVLEPQDFMVKQNGALINKLDGKEINDLSNLINAIRSKNITVASFSKIVDTLPKAYSSQPSATSIINTSKSCDIRLSLKGDKNINVLLQAPDPIPVEGLSGDKCSFAEIYNTYGKYLYNKSKEIGISPSVAAGVLYIESAGQGFAPDGRMTIRFEACIFQKLWGEKNQEEFSNHFQCNTPNDGFRISTTMPFTQYHGDANKEWKVFDLARALDEDAAIKSTSVGISQMMGFHYKEVGYASAKAMFDVMTQSIKPQLDAFFLQLAHYQNNGISCLSSLKSSDYDLFAKCYNAANQDQIYANKLMEAANSYRSITAGRLFAA
jgi:peptidoglycan/xylan/chitin deacetylase (PgdA/CDA1 family)